MLDLWKKRLRRHEMQQFKYLRLVFNDHFVIALIFLVGALAVGYSNLLKMVHSTFWWGPIAAAILYAATLSIGKLATLMEEADGTFLLPKESDFFHYLMAARRYSLTLPVILIILCNLAILPLSMTIIGQYSILKSVVIVLSLLFFKDVQLWLAFVGGYEKSQQIPVMVQHTSYFYGATFVFILLGLYLSPWITLVLAIVWDLWMRRNISDYTLNGDLRFEYLITAENNRQFKILKIYNLFTDVPSLQSSAKRRKYLDFILKGIKPSQKNTYLYLFARGFIRGTEYLGFYLRFLIIGTIILFFVHQSWVSWMLYLVFLYLSGFQLLPFFEQYDNIVFMHLYPVNRDLKTKSFNRLILILLTVQWVITSIPILVLYHHGLIGIGIVVSGLTFVTLFISFYTNIRLKRLTA